VGGRRGEGREGGKRRFGCMYVCKEEVTCEEIEQVLIVDVSLRFYSTYAHTHTRELLYLDLKASLSPKNTPVIT